MGFCNSCGEILYDNKCKCGGGKKELDGFENSQPSQVPNTYLSQGFRGGVESSLKTMMHGDDKPLNYKCAGCNLALTSSNQVFPGLTGEHEGKPFCEQCYSSKWNKGSCKGCNKAVLGQGKVWVKDSDGGLWHKECFKGKPCVNCKAEIIGHGVGVEDLVFHEKCFNCEICNASLLKNGQFALRNKSVICSNCASAAQIKAAEKVKSNGNISTALPAEKKEKIIINNNQGKQNCAFCNLVLGTNEQLLQITGDQLIHAKCLKCGKCNQQIDNSNGFVKGTNNQYFHPKCVNAGGPKPVCSSCYRDITDGFVDFEGKKFHSNCFKCSKCLKSLAGVPFGKLQGDAACESCLVAGLKSENPKVVQNSSGSTITYGLKPGFTVNPMTGEKEIRDAGFANNVAQKLNTLGGSNICPRCQKTMYPGDKVTFPNIDSWP
ncbi:Four and a half LIM domains protein 5 [Terramyces sp. JEL0728]|nr:Four and a half LIM domains protein 5 [Terramyces sp. JEL0728]